MGYREILSHTPNSKQLGVMLASGMWATSFLQVRLVLTFPTSMSKLDKQLSQIDPHFK